MLEESHYIILLYAYDIKLIPISAENNLELQMQRKI